MKQEDNLAKDLAKMLDVKWNVDQVFDGAGKLEAETYWAIPEDVKKHLMTDLVVYIKERDARVGDHWFKVGQANRRRNEGSS